MGCGCSRFNGYYLDAWDDEVDDEVECEDNVVDNIVEVTKDTIIYHGSKESRSLEKMVNRGILEVDTYLLFKNGSIRELGIVRRINGKVCIEYDNQHLSLLQFCKKAAEKHDKEYTGTPWNSVWIIDEDDQPFERIGKLWDTHKKEASELRSVDLKED
jgi:hypothetical protein